VNPPKSKKRKRGDLSFLSLNCQGVDGDDRDAAIKKLKSPTPRESVPTINLLWSQR
jgi:hypothetical protein